MCMYLLSLLLSFSSAKAKEAQPLATVSDAVQSRLEKGQSTDIIVYLKKNAELKEAKTTMSRLKRIEYVRQSLKQTAISTQSEVVELLNKSRINHKAFYIENAIAIKNAKPNLVHQLQQIKSVSYIGKDAKASLQLPKVNALKGLSTKSVPSHLLIIQANKVWDELGTKGKGIVIGGQDTGYYWEHNALKKKYRGYSALGVTDHNYNWHDTFTSCKNSPCDDHSHGTHTMGTMIGSDGENQIGVAPEAQWIGCRNMLNGVGQVSSYLECFEFFLAPYPIDGNSREDGKVSMAPHIVNNSWSCPPKEGCTGGELLDAVKAMKAAGIAVVAAAGNQGPNCGSVGSPPGTYGSELMSVGAYNRYSKDIAFFSSLGPSAWDGGLAPNIVAPGAMIRSSVTGSPNKYDDKAGTSMASPQVAGVIALMWSAKPELIGDVDRTFDILKKTATPMTGRTSCNGFPGNKIPNAVFGYGMLNAYEAAKAN